jgi:hypothetical protein
MFKRIYFFIIGLLITTIYTDGQQIQDKPPVTVYAKIWSKVNGKSVYSDWTRFKAVVVDELPDYEPVNNSGFNKYGSYFKIKAPATGFFYTKKINNRWWIIDPEGFANLSVAVNGVRQGPSARNKEELIKKFGTAENWITQTHSDLINLGFNGTGCWSEVPSIQLTNLNSDKPLIYSMIWNFYSSYKNQKTNKSGEVSFSVFDPEFEVFVDKKALELQKTKDDPNLLGHFSDNELEFKTIILDEYLSINNKKDLNYQAAEKFLEKMELNRNQINDSIRELFLEVAADKYYQVISSAIKKYDPNHLYLGSRLHGKPKNNEGIVRAIGKYADIISINYYGKWEPSDSNFENWMEWTDKPIIITEFYTKGMDSGMENNSGAGWIVRTQDERGIHYENFCIKLLQQKNCVGWHWFRYMDNDPTDLTADPSNNDSNKGIVDNTYKQYFELTKHIQILNLNRYNLIEYFDKKN